MSEVQAWRGKTFRDLVNDAKGRINQIDKETVAEWIAEGKVILVDVREASDYANGHIDGALSIPRGVLELEVDEMIPDQDALIVTYCGGGSRSALAADTLQQMGYENVYSLTGGYRGWNQ